MRTIVVDDAPTLRPDLAGVTDHTTARTPGLLTLLFELSLAVALPPAAILAPPRAIRPAVHSDPHAILTPLELTGLLERPTTEVGRGRVALEEVDGRLRGLVVWLDVFRVTDGSGALVSLSVVRPDPDAVGGATPADLWRLACEASVEFEVACENVVGIGDDAFLAIHGNRTAQVAWVAGDRLSTASVTCLAGDKEWAVEAARAIAVLADACLEFEDGRDEWPFVRRPGR